MTERHTTEEGNEMTNIHADDCVGAGSCQPINGQWVQPAASWVEMAKAVLGDDAPWCQIRMFAWDLDMGSQGGPTRVGDDD